MFVVELELGWREEKMELDVTSGTQLETREENKIHGGVKLRSKKETIKDTKKWFSLKTTSFDMKIQPKGDKHL